MQVPRVSYTRVEARDNPDYQVLGKSPDCGAMVTDAALDGFFRSLLGQPDSLTGFTRGCFFAPLSQPLPDTVRPVWVAGVARPSDRPDRHGRHGILNYSAMVFSDEQAAKMHHNPWQLFEDPATTDEMLPFVDTLDHTFTAAELPAAWFSNAASGTAATGAGGDADVARIIGDPIREQIIAALVDGHCILITPATATDKPDAALEAVLRSLHCELPPHIRRDVAMLTHSFRPTTSATRFQLIGAAGDAPTGDRKWRHLATAWQPVAEGLEPIAVDVRLRHAEVSASGRVATHVPPSRAAYATHDQTRAFARWSRSGSNWLLAHPVVGGASGLILVAALVFLVFGPRGWSGNDGGNSPSAHPSNHPADAGNLPPVRNQPPDATGNGNTNRHPSDMRPEAWTPEALDERWRATGAWRGMIGDPGVRRRYDDFVQFFRPGLRSLWGETAPASWPPDLLRLASQVAWVLWEIDGHNERELFAEYQFLLSAEALRVFGPIRVQLTVLSP
ncbi:MAG: hypothetical protein AB7S36_23605, partial [Planctomycetota bacterium]